ncbi:transglutaminase-like domain-containing protein [Altericroceibacterium xinjiangense]|uniref:transglutaminase-like domain-containing protein n=1 Tax=Altericroceibacterium xinjiangense TaxID=762261 RepID=UPI000F7EA3BB|nr:transglutaminase family protein [Altericroceibacterium xinjiangense]
MRLKIEALLHYSLPSPADILLAIEAAPTQEQRLVVDKLTVSGGEPLRTVPGDDGIGRRTWVHAEGQFYAEYHGTFIVERMCEPLVELPVTPRRALPAEVIPYLWPSRFCESDRFASFVTREFGHLEGGACVEAMARWIRKNIAYQSGASNEKTGAVDTFVARAGVCRDYAHVMAAFSRAAGIPARLVSAYAWKLDPPDFHAVVEVWLDGQWRLVDASGLAPVEGLVRIAVGRDATDISFMTIFGSAELVNQQVRVTE